MTLTRHNSPFPHWQFTAASGDQLQVVPERGGLVVGWRCAGEERLYFDAERFADPAKSVRGGIPVLFPVCGNLPGNALVLPQGSFSLTQHGFARDLPWQLEALASGDGLRLSLSDSDATRAVYPFAFQLSLEYRLERRALAIQARVEHCGGGDPAEAMPFALGLHPYFQVESLGQARLEGLPAECCDHLSAAAASTADQLQRLEQGVDLRVDGNGLRPQLRTGRGVVELQMQPPFEHAVVWSDPPRPMVCLEPWSARRGDLSQVLQPGETAELHCRYALTPA
jgi:galactose mutarotase-like enzyme